MLRLLLQKSFLACLPIGLLIVAGCNPDSTTQKFPLRSVEGQVVATPHRSGETSGRFELLTNTGIEFRNDLKSENQISYLTNGAGVTIGDFDNDGRPDVFFSGQDVPNRLYQQVENFQFEDVTDAAGVGGGDNIAAGCTFVDINNDGWLDIYVCNYLTNNELFVNQGDGTFLEQAFDYELAYSGPSTMASFADYDRDGDLDVYLVNNRRYRQEKENSEKKLIKAKDGEIQMPPHMFFKKQGRWLRTGHRDLLMRNENGKFQIVNEVTGVGDYGSGLSATWFDVNNDDLPDLWVGNDLKSPDHLYVNQGDGTFKDMLAEMVSYTTWNSMGADFADFNNDGHFDMLVADMSATTHYKEKTNMGEMDSEAWFLSSEEPRQFMRNCLYINTGSERFMESAFASGIARTDWTWTVKCADFDCDGMVDVFVTNGMVDNSNDADWVAKRAELEAAGKKEEAAKLLPPQLIEQNLAFRNTGGLKFDNKSAEWGLNEEKISHGAALGDLDGDGDLDLIVNNFAHPASIYRNDTNSNRRISVELFGAQSNRFGLGARLTLETSAGKQHQILASARGYMSSDQPIVHFGLGTSTEINKLTIRWPSGIVQILDDVKADHHYQIAEPASSDVRSKRAVAAAKPMFAKTDTIQYHHQESNFDDFGKQLLLPNRLSTQGPGMAWGDANGDGNPDVFLGGAAGKAGKLFLGVSGSFMEVAGPWEKDASCEDMGICWVDVDSDGDLDLFVASGSYEHVDNPGALKNRMYINGGDGTFTNETTRWLPGLVDASGTVAAGDFDRDGNIDLFVGSRLVPGMYPAKPTSRLLRNTGEKFVEYDSTKHDLETLGLVTGATWCDLDNDNWIDLVVCSEWGPISIFSNQKGQLKDHTQSLGLDEQLGWWNGVSVGDFDGNGLPDIVATNFGLNTKYGSPSTKKPISLFFGDMDSDGSLELVEAKKKNEQLLPVRGRSCSCHQLPELKEKFPSYHDFALAELDDIYELSKTNELRCTELNSVIILNFGDRMEVRHLPFLAQLAPSFGSTVSDFNGDGHDDIFMLHNFYGPQIETGRMSGGLSALLLGNGDGTFREVWPEQSGLVIPDDARSVAVVDLNADQKPDLLVGSCDGRTKTFLNQTDSSFAVIRLAAPSVGSQVRVTNGKTTKTFPVSSNSGYLSQSLPQFFLGAPDKQAIEVTVTWPDGEVSTSKVSDFDEAFITLQQHQNQAGKNPTSTSTNSQN